MKTLIGFTGRLGSGKDYTAFKMVEDFKNTGNTIYMISFADPIKQILKNSFGFTKSGKVKGNFPKFDKHYVKSEIVNSLYNLIKDLGYDKFDVCEDDAKAYIANNYMKYENDFYGFVTKAKDNIDYGFAFRRLGQLLGTELGRYIVDTIWVDIAFNKVKKVFKSDLADIAIITDVRFMNEYNKIEEFKILTAFDSICYGITATDETRARRRGMSLVELKAQDEHGSEMEIDDIIACLPKKCVIDNNG